MSEPPGGVGREELSAYLDGELDAARRLTVERHLARCPDDAEMVAAFRARDAALRLATHDLVDQDLPARLAAPLVAARRRRLGALAAAALLALVAGFGAWHMSRQGDHTAADLATLVQDAVAAHRGYVAGQGATAAMTPARDETVIAAPDLAGFGYRLVGSQLIVTGAGPAIQFFYVDAAGQEVTCFFAAFAGLPAAAPASRAVDGIETVYRVDEGIGYVVAGGAPREQLAAIAAEVYESAEATRTGG